jgi:hypothetical protein
VVPDGWRQAEITKIIEGLKDEERALFRVCLLDELIPELLKL